MNIKKTLLFAAVLLMAAFHAKAQYAPGYSRSLKLDIGLSSGLSTGPVSGYFPEAGGISVGLEVPIRQSPVNVVFSTGYTFYVSGGGYDVGFDSGYGYGYGAYYSGDIASFIPVEAGLKVFPARRFFIEGLGGASFNVNNYSSDYTYKTTAFIYSFGAGYSFPLGFRGRNSTDLSAFYENRPEPGGGYSQVGVKAVFSFTLR